MAWGDPIPYTAKPRIPILNFEPWNGITDIADGTRDGLIDRYAWTIHKIDGPVFVRFAHEMNGNWTPWSGDPELYKAAFRRFYLRVAAIAKNAKVIWCPNIGDVPADNKAIHYYPGDDYCDIIGVDGYNFGTGQSWGSTWQTPTAIFSAFHDAWVNVKPLMICETGSSSSGGDKALWINELRLALKTRLNGFAAVVYFDESKPSKDWAIDSPQSVVSPFKEFANDAYFKQRRR